VGNSYLQKTEAHDKDPERQILDLYKLLADTRDKAKGKSSTEREDLLLSFEMPLGNLRSLLVQQLMYYDARIARLFNWYPDHDQTCTIKPFEHKMLIDWLSERRQNYVTKLSDLQPLWLELRSYAGVQYKERVKEQAKRVRVSLESRTREMQIDIAEDRTEGLSPHEIIEAGLFCQPGVYGNYNRELSAYVRGNKTSFPTPVSNPEAPICRSCSHHSLILNKTGDKYYCTNYDCSGYGLAVLKVL